MKLRPALIGIPVHASYHWVHSSDNERSIMNQGRFISRNAQYWPDRPAILFNGQVTTFRELDERSSRLANALLALGAKKGDRIGVQAWNRPELIELECALYKA